MSKLYDKYVELKNEKQECIYLFHTGIFYIFLEKDAEVMSEKLNLKLVPFATGVLKCGFPHNTLNYYLEKINEKEIPYEIIEWQGKSKNKQKKETPAKEEQATNEAIVKRLDETNVYQITPFQALEILVELKELLHRGK